MKVIFITREGSQMPAVRIRCHGFAESLRKAGMETEIFSYPEELGAKSGAAEHTMRNVDKIMYNMKAFKRLFAKEAVLFLQRCHYHSFAPFFLRIFKNRKLIFDLDDWEARENITYFFNTIPRSKAEIAMRCIAAKSDFCTAASKFLLDFLLPFNKNVAYVPTGVDTDIFKPEESTEAEREKIVLSWMGTIYRRDNVENIQFLIDYFRSLSNRYGNVRLEILGEGIYARQVYDMVRQCKDADIEFKTWIDPVEVPAYLRTIDIGVMPLIQQTRFNKAKSPTRLFEYMAMEKPVVASPIGESVSIIRDGENGFLASTRQEFVSKLTSIIEDRKLARTLGKNARKTVLKNYSLKVASERLMQVMNSL